VHGPRVMTSVFDLIIYAASVAVMEVAVAELLVDQKE
jgi:hypothetical protein